MASVYNENLEINDKNTMKICITSIKNLIKILKNFEKFYE